LREHWRKLAVFVVLVSLIFFVLWDAKRSENSAPSLDSSNDMTDEAREAQWLTKYPQFFARTGSVLKLNFASGKSKEFESKRGDSYETFHLVFVRRFHPDEGLVELRHHFYEGAAVELVSITTGDSIHLEGSGELLWSPNRRYFAWTNADESSFTEPQTLIASCARAEAGSACRTIYNVKREGGKAAWKSDESGVEIALLKYDSASTNGWVEKGLLTCRLTSDKADCTESKK
jgi:hypothetical protein